MDDDVKDRIDDDDAVGVATGDHADELADDVLDELLIEEISIDGMCGVY